VPTVNQHLDGRAPQVRGIYDRLLAAVRKFGPVEEDPKKTSIHLNRKSAFAGIATRKTAVIVTLKSTADIKSPRIVKHQRQSASRWYLDVRLEGPAEVDRELQQWLRASYELSQ
jgi:hypothetical protein